MFAGKDLKVKLVYMGFGGMIAIIGMLFAIWDVVFRDGAK